MTPPDRSPVHWSSRLLVALVLVFLLPVPAGAAVCRCAGFCDQPGCPGLLSLVTNHVVRADQDGLAVWSDLRIGLLPHTRSNFVQYVDQILDRAEEWAACETRAGRLPRSESGDSKRVVVPVLIHVHGGLNTWRNTYERMQLVPRILHERIQEDRAYPVFIAWPAGPFDTYGEHLFSLRSGVRERGRAGKAFAWITAPFVLGTDLGKAAVGLPIAWAHQGANFRDQAAYPKGRDQAPRIVPRELLGGLFQLANDSGRLGVLERDGYRIERGTVDPRTAKELTGRFGRASLLTPVRATLGTIAQGDLSSAAWRVMKRRTLNIYRPAQEMEWIDDRPGKDAIDCRVNAGRFLTRLLERAEKAHGEGFEYRVTIVGHSMGTFVLNHFLERERERLVRLGILRRIVYMGAACSVRDAVSAVGPLLESCQGEGLCRGRLTFHNLTLHPLAEIAENMGGGVMPSGSLLYQIDTHLENPNTALDRTLGWEINTLAAIEEFEGVRQHCVFRSFNFDPDTLPMVHGDFGRCPFWRSSFVGARGTADINPESLAPRHAAGDPGDHVRNYRSNWMTLEDLVWGR